MRLEANDAIEFHGPFISTYQLPTNEKVTQLRFAIGCALILQFLLIFEYFRKSQQPNEKWMMAWCIINFFNNSLHTSQLIYYFEVKKLVFEINGWAVLWQCEPNWFTMVVGIVYWFVLLQPVNWIADHYYLDKRIGEKIAGFLISRAIMLLLVIESIMVFGFLILRIPVHMLKIVKRIHYPLRI